MTKDKYIEDLKQAIVSKNPDAMLVDGHDDALAGYDTRGRAIYRIEGLNLLGEPVDETTINVDAKRDAAKKIPSRVESDARLKGTKRIIVRQGNVYIGKGRKDDRSRWRTGN